MIQVAFARAGEERILTLRGHATGSPAVCAGASAIVYALAGWLKNAGAEGLELRLRPGDARIVCRGGPVTDTAFHIALTGLAQLGASYPCYLRLHTGVNGLQADDIHIPKERSCFS